jgi:hypothetical protein
MITDDALVARLRSAMPPSEFRRPSRDLWPRVRRSEPAGRGLMLIDLGLAAAVAACLIAFPQWFWVLAYHL